MESLPGKFDAFSTKFDNLSKEVSDLSASHIETSDKVVKLENVIETLKSEVSVLKSNVSSSGNFDKVSTNVNRDKLITGIVITGCPKLPRESTKDLIDILVKIAAILNIDFSPNNLFSVYRIPNKNAKEKLDRVSYPIIARFISKILRDEWLAAKKNKNDLKASEINSDWDELPVFIRRKLVSVGTKNF